MKQKEVEFESSALQRSNVIRILVSRQTVTYVHVNVFKSIYPSKIIFLFIKKKKKQLLFVPINKRGHCSDSLQTSNQIIVVSQTFMIIASFLREEIE